MRTYTTEEATLQAWKDKLTNDKKIKHDELYNELMGILNGEKEAICRLDALNREINILLGDDHRQGINWKPHFDWFWKFLSYFLPASWQLPKSGSPLRRALSEMRHALSEKLVVNEISLTFAEYQTCEDKSLDNDKAFEDALFKEPSKALSDIKFDLEKIGGLEPEKKNHLLTKVKAIKYLLDPYLYQQLLESLYQNAPTETIRFFYKAYQEEHYETPRSQDYVELHMMARHLMEKFVLKFNDFELLNHHLRYLLVLAELSTRKDTATNKKNTSLCKDHSDDPLSEVINGDVSSLSDYYANRLLNNLKNEIIASNKKITESALDTPLTVLQCIFDIHKNNGNKRNPLLKHIIRQACESLHTIYRKDRLLDDDKKRKIKEIIDFIKKENIISTVGNNEKDDMKTSSFWENVLDPMFDDSVPDRLKLAEQSALSLVLANTINQDEVKRKIDNIKDIIKPKFTNSEFEWILYRCKDLAEDSKMYLREHLMGQTVHNNNDDDLHPQKNDSICLEQSNKKGDKIAVSNNERSFFYSSGLNQGVSITEPGAFHDQKITSQIMLNSLT